MANAQGDQQSIQSPSQSQVKAGSNSNVNSENQSKIQSEESPDKTQQSPDRLPQVIGPKKIFNMALTNEQIAEAEKEEAKLRLIEGTDGKENMNPINRLSDDQSDNIAESNHSSNNR